MCDNTWEALGIKKFTQALASRDFTKDLGIQSPPDWP